MDLFLLCIKIFFARLIDVSLGTFRTIMTIKGKDLYAALIGLIEITVWFLVVKEALNTTNNSFFIVISYALGFSIGTYIGGKISKIFIHTTYEVQVILSERKLEIIDEIKKSGYGVSAIEILGNKYMLYIEIKDNSLNRLRNIIINNDPKAFITVGETKYVQNGYFGVSK